MKRKGLKRTGCVLLCAILLTGCSIPGLGKLEQPYSFADRQALYQLTDSDIGKAEAFAADLCVIEDESQYSDSSVDAEAAAVFGVSDQSVVFSKNAFERLYPASTTKVMTALIAIKYGTLTDEVTVTDDVVITESGATMCGIKPGDVITMEQLLYGLMLPSGNDAGAAIAVHMDNSIEKFSERMNQEALKLGATGTHFMNPHGLNDEQHYTTPYDLYLIFNEAMKQPLFREIIGTKAYTANYKDSAGNPVSQTWSCSNQYITGEQETPEGLTVLGGKTGTTKAAGNCLVMGSDDSQGKEYISVVMKANGRESLYKNMTNIINKIVE